MARFQARYTPKVSTNAGSQPPLATYFRYVEKMGDSPWTLEMRAILATLPTPQLDRELTPSIPFSE